MQPEELQADRRQRILHAAREEFAGVGLAGGRTARIAARAGVNKQLIFYYFGSKAGLYDAVVRGAGNTLRGTPERGRHEAGETPAERIRSILGGVYHMLDRHPDLVGLLTRGIGEPGAARTALSGFVLNLVAELSGVISEGQGLGYFRDDREPNRAAMQAVVLALGYLPLEAVLTQGPVRSHRAEWLDRACDLLIGELTW